MNRFVTRPDRIHALVREHVLADGFHVVIDLDRSHGSWIVDAVSGREILDFYSYFASLPVGHNHPRLVGDPEFMARSPARPSPTRPTPTSTPGSSRPSSRPSRGSRSPPTFRHLFFVDGGALAVENALKTAFDWKVRGEPAQPDGAIADPRSSTSARPSTAARGYTLSLTNTDPVKTERLPEVRLAADHQPEARASRSRPRSRRTPPPLEQPGGRRDRGGLRRPPGRHRRHHHRADPGRGRRQPLPRRVPRRRCAGSPTSTRPCSSSTRCRPASALTGKMWAYQHFGVDPDIVVFGKKTQVCGIMASPRIDEVADNVFATPGRINSTWGGNLVDMVRCVRYLEIIDEERLGRQRRPHGRPLSRRPPGARVAPPGDVERSRPGAVLRLHAAVGRRAGPAAQFAVGAWAGDARLVAAVAALPPLPQRHRRRGRRGARSARRRPDGARNGGPTAPGCADLAVAV